jgi:23S rRNA pseudouridine1911/1915/1917 synthase
MAASEGRDSLTYYKMLTANALCSFVLLRIITGRTHQIRVHLKENGHAIIGDCDYGKGANVELEKFLSGGMDESLRRAWTEALPETPARAHMRNVVRDCPGFFLHAYSLSFTHPFTGQAVALLAPLPDYFAAMCTIFGWEAPVDPNALLAIRGVDA